MKEWSVEYMTLLEAYPIHGNPLLTLEMALGIVDRCKKDGAIRPFRLTNITTGHTIIL